MQPSPGLHAVDFGFLVSETWIPVPTVNGIPDSKAHEFRIPQANITRNVDSASKRVPDSGFRILTRAKQTAINCYIAG